jgi:hypothetical protein
MAGHKSKSTRAWAEEHFSEADMCDVRNVDRLIFIAAAMAESPGSTIPQMFSSRSDVKGAYRFFEKEEATPANIQAGHRDIVFELIRSPGTHLLIEDTSEVSWEHTIEGMGPVGGTKQPKGFHLHSVLAVKWSYTGGDKRWPVELEGLVDQQFYIRKPAPEGEKKNDSKIIKKRERESQLWERSTEFIGAKPESNKLRWVRICDRGADIYELLLGCIQMGHDFVIRAAYNRLLKDPETGAKSGRLLDEIRMEKPSGRMHVELRERPGRRARIAELSVSAKVMLIGAPQRPGKGPGMLEPIRCTVVRVWEEKRVEGEQPLEWTLLCSGEFTDFTQARERVLMYSARWIIEEFHKALKTGLGVEKLQLESSARIFAAAAIMSIVALRLIALREAARSTPTAPVEESGFSPLEIKVLEEKAGRKLLSLSDLALALARLGGHLNRKSDGPPGWQTLWRGMLKLNSIVEGVQLALKMKNFG